MINIENCVICLDELNKSNTFVITTCSHKLHKVCFETYFHYNYDVEKNSISCPICRRIIPVEKKHNSAIFKNVHFILLIQLLLYGSFLSMLILIISTIVSSLEIE